eukprot:UN20856
MMTDLGETPSDGFKIEIGVWGVLRASENSASKILRISKPFSNSVRFVIYVYIRIFCIRDQSKKTYISVYNRI